MIPLFHPDYRTPDYAAQLRDLPHDIAGLSAQNAKPIGDPALFDKSIEVVHELMQRDIIARYGRWNILSGRGHIFLSGMGYLIWAATENQGGSDRAGTIGQVLRSGSKKLGNWAQVS